MDDHDKRRHHDPAYNDARIREKVPSQKFSHALAKAFKDKLHE